MIRCTLFVLAASLMTSLAAWAQSPSAIDLLRSEEFPNILSKMRNPPKIGKARLAQIARESGQLRVGGVGLSRKVWVETREAVLETLERCDLVFPVAMRAYENYAKKLNEPLDEALKAEVRLAIEHPKTARALEDCINTIWMSAMHFTKMGKPYDDFNEHLDQMRQQLTAEFAEQTRRRQYSPSPAGSEGSGAGAAR